MNKFTIYDKAKRVIESCTDAKYLPMCQKFVKLAQQRMLEAGMKSQFVGEAYFDLDRKMTAKRDELYPKTDNAGLAGGMSQAQLEAMYAQNAARQMADVRGMRNLWSRGSSDTD